ncbi:MAG: HlyD family efflux transporter periplasmic adaptor subunit [Anaerolineae bacterium]|nr:HlyD family efflux transporter periplasmic adaptor subunit [Anaerolineae bacterium]
MSRLRLIVALCIAIALAAGCGGVGAEPAPDTPPAPSEPPAASEKEAQAATTPLISAGRAILMDGELVAGSPPLQLAFSEGVRGALLELPVRVGQRVRAGQQIARVDDAALQRAVEDTQRSLARAIEDRERAEADADETYQREVDQARERYEDALLQAQRALTAAQAALARAQMQPPTTPVAEAQVQLARAREAEDKAYDDYKQALDRPWEPQQIRDTLYKEWQRRIVDRELAELHLADARTALQAHYLDVESRQRDVAQAEEDLSLVRQDEVTRREDPTHARAVEDAERRLAEAQDALADARLAAPWAGLVTEVHVNIGSTVQAGAPIVTLINLEQLTFVTQNLSERHIAQLSAGQRAEITLRAYPERVLVGRVETIVPRSATAGDAAPFAAHIRLEGADLDLLPGMTGRVEVVSEEP